MKLSKLLSLCCAALVLILLAGCTAMTGEQTLAPPAIRQPSDPNAMRTVQVLGVGEGQVEPDVAVINFGVQTEADTAQDALQENSIKMQALIDALEGANIPAENIQTQAIRLSPRYEFNETDNSRALVGYTASNVLEVRTTDLESLGTLLDQAVNAGTNTIENIRFDVSNVERMLDQVREIAVEDARHKATERAALTATTLGPILEIQESSSTPGPVLRQIDAAAESAAVPVLPGVQTVSVQVQVTWVLIVDDQK